MPNETGVPTLQDLLTQANEMANTKRKTDASDDQTRDLLKLLQIKNLQDERDDRAVTELEKRATSAGTAQIIPSMQRVEQLAPGAMSGQGKFKSVGGIKNLAPNFAVPVLEKLGIMDTGAADERAALQDIINTKIYDSSGKAISIPESARIEQGMGLKGMFDPSATNQALKQLGETAFQKQQNVTAGARPRAVETFKKRGGTAGYSSLQEMLGQPAQQAQQPPSAPAIPAAAPAISPEQRLQELRSKYRK